MSYPEKALDRARRHREELAAAYNVPPSRIIWIGNTNYIIVTAEGEEIRI